MATLGPRSDATGSAEHQFWAALNQVLGEGLVPSGSSSELEIDALGIDSLGFLEVVYALECTGIEIEDRALDSVHTIGDLLAACLEAATGLARSPASTGPSADHCMGSGAFAPALCSRRVCLRPFEPTDELALYRLALAPTVGYRYRFRGTTPSFSDFQLALRQDVLVQFAVDRRSTDELIGLVSCFAANLRDGHAHLGALINPRHHLRGWPLEAVGLLVEYVFALFDLHKLYLQVSDLNAGATNHLPAFAEEEVRLTDHDFYRGRYWDSRILALSRERWLDADNQLRRQLLSTADPKEVLQ